MTRITKKQPDGANCAAVILAGGAARRLGGGDKCLIELGGKPVLDHILDRLGGEPISAVALSANGDPARFDRWGLPVLPDPEGAAGPGAGVLAGLVWAETLACEWLLTVPGDTPFPPRGLGATLAAATKGAPVAFAHIGGDLRPDMGVWRVSVRSAFEAAIGKGELALRRLGHGLGAQAVEIEDNDGRPVWGINTPDDLERMRKALAVL